MDWLKGVYQQYIYILSRISKCEIEIEFRNCNNDFILKIRKYNHCLEITQITLIIRRPIATNPFRKGDRA